MRRIITIALTFLVGAGIMVAVPAAPTARAAESCPLGVFCAWSEDNMGGTIFKYAYSVYGVHHHCNNLTTLSPSGDHNTWESAQNKYGDQTETNGPAVYYYNSTNCTGLPGSVGFKGSTNVIGSYWSNKVRSFKVVE